MNRVDSTDAPEGYIAKECTGVCCGCAFDGTKCGYNSNKKLSCLGVQRKDGFSVIFVKKEVKLDEPRFVLQHNSGVFFVKQSLYFGVAVLVKDIDLAMDMTLKQAEEKLSRMDKKDEWKIMELVWGRRLGKENTRHIKRERKTQLEKELAELGEL